MTPLKTENLELKFEDNIAYMSVSGQVTQESMAAGYDWFKEITETHDKLNICVDMAKADFPDLSAVADQFRNVSNVLRVALGADKCAVLSDSAFVRNSAKVEGAVIPGLNLLTFKLGQSDPAVKWLKGESLMTEEEKEESLITPKADDDSEADPWSKLNMKKFA